MPSNGDHPPRKADVYTIPLRVAARELCVAKATLRRWAAEGKLPYRRTPTGRLYFAPADLDTIKAETRAT